VVTQWTSLCVTWNATAGFRRKEPGFVSQGAEIFGSDAGHLIFNWNCDWLSTGGADKSLAQPPSRYILFGVENITFDAGLVIYIYRNSTNIPPIMIINRIYETQNLMSQ
jgi:hypothetical protein